MAPSTLFALVALTSLTYVAGQSTTPAPAATTAGAVPTFPATPLADYHYPYNQLVRILFCGLLF